MGEELQQDEMLSKLTSVVKDLVDNTDMSVADVLNLMQGRSPVQSVQGPTRPWMPIKPTVTRVRIVETENIMSMSSYCWVEYWNALLHI